MSPNTNNTIAEVNLSKSLNCLQPQLIKTDGFSGSFKFESIPDNFNEWTGYQLLLNE